MIAFTTGNAIMLHKWNPLRSISVRRTAAVLVFAGLFAGAVQAAETPATVAGAKIVAAEDVVKAMAAGATVVDTRVASEYADAHIKGAISVPYREKSAKSADFDAGQDSFDLKKLPGDKGAAVVFYCNGPECWKSFKATMWALKGGYTNVQYYRLGFPEWKSKGLPSE
jgi:rhodanese-related sulfurtransferase